VSDTAERRCIRCNVTDSRYHEVHGGHLIGLHAPECDYHTGCMLRQEAIAAHAAGYAEAVADLRRWLVAECKAARGERKRARCNEYSRLIGILDIGAHVGAAKKGVSNG
jgi:hypothetical protein